MNIFSLEFKINSSIHSGVPPLSTIQCFYFRLFSSTFNFLLHQPRPHQTKEDTVPATVRLCSDQSFIPQSDSKLYVFQWTNESNDFRKNYIQSTISILLRDSIKTRQTSFVIFDTSLLDKLLSSILFWKLFVYSFICHQAELCSFNRLEVMFH